MVFDIQWLLLALPLAFGLGWWASRMDWRQWQQRHTDQPQAYFKGLSLLLNEQQDKAIDAFIEAIQDDPLAVELHFALGNLFRRRGEFERSIRIHEHLLARGDLSPDDHDRAQFALAQDFFRAGLFDRAEQAFAPLTQRSIYQIESLTALLSLHERSHDWRRAIEVASQLAQRDQGDFTRRMAHYHCELAEEAWSLGDQAGAWEALKAAQSVSPMTARPWILQAKWHQPNEPLKALETWEALLQHQAPAFDLVAMDYAQTALEVGQGERAKLAMANQPPSSDTRRMKAQALLRASTGPSPDELRSSGSRFWSEQLQKHPKLSCAEELLKTDHRAWSDDTWAALRQAVSTAAKPMQRHRCAACGFEARHYFWQCPGCLGWDTFPSATVEDL